MGATKRIVVWDTTAGRVPDDEVMFVFGHESGHYVLNHIPKMLAGFAVALFFVYWGCAGFADWLARRFGERWGAGCRRAAAGVPRRICGAAVHDLGGELCAGARVERLQPAL